MEISVEDENGVGEGVGGITGAQCPVGFFLFCVIELSDGIEDSSNLLRFSCEEEVAGEKSDEFFKIMLFALLEHDFCICCEELC